MIKWLKNLLGFGTVVNVVNEVFPEIPEEPKPIKKVVKKASKVDFDSMKKNELLAYAKKNGIKANASMNKAALIKILK